MPYLYADMQHGTNKLGKREHLRYSSFIVNFIDIEKKASFDKHI